MPGIRSGFIHRRNCGAQVLHKCVIGNFGAARKYFAKDVNLVIGVTCIFWQALVRHAILRRNFKGGAPQDLQVKPERAPSQIFRVKAYLLWNGQFIAAIDLRPTGQTWHQVAHAARGAQFNEVCLIKQRGSRANETHVAFENAPQLRNLIKAGFSQQRADRRYVRCGFGKQMSWLCWRAHAHGAKLWHAKDSVAPADAIRPIERGPGRCDLHSEADAQPRHGKEREQCKGE